LRRLSSYDWPGNVRQLEHVLLNAWLMSDQTELDATDIELPSSGLGSTAPSAAVGAANFAGPVAPPTSSKRSASGSSSAGTSSRGEKTSRARAQTPEEFKQADKDRILGALTQAGWNRLKAAELLGVPRRTFYRRLREYGIL
jgi:serine/threonine-protein kinase PknK